MEATQASLRIIPTDDRTRDAAPTPVGVPLPGFGWFLMIPISFATTLAAVIWVTTHAVR